MILIRAAKFALIQTDMKYVWNINNSSVLMGFFCLEKSFESRARLGLH